MYWTDAGDTDKIQRADLDGSNVEDLVTSGLDNPTGIIALESTVLPVELLYFQGYFDNPIVNLKWGTATEMNNDYFAVQRSYNGSDFKTLSRISGAGSTSTNKTYYITDDQIILNKKIAYYRLKQVDFDGTSTYSQVISVLINGENQIQVYPNPTHGNIKIIGVAENEAEVKIKDDLGRTIGLFQLLNSNLDISKFSSGVYLLEINTGNQRVIKRIIKK